MIPVGAVGRLTNGSRPGWWVQVEPYVGGFSIQTSASRDFEGEGYDNWVENLEQLEAFFARTEWATDWNPGEAGEPQG